MHLELNNLFLSVICEYSLTLVNISCICILAYHHMILWIRSQWYYIKNKGIQVGSGDFSTWKEACLDFSESVQLANKNLAIFKFRSLTKHLLTLIFIWSRSMMKQILEYKCNVAIVFIFISANAFLKNFSSLGEERKKESTTHISESQLLTVQLSFTVQ